MNYDSIMNFLYFFTENFSKKQIDCELLCDTSIVFIFVKISENYELIMTQNE